MNVYATYILSSEGIPLLTEYYQEVKNVPNEVILSGLLTAMQEIATDLAKQKGAAEKFVFRGLTYHLKSFEDFQVVIVSDVDKIPSMAIDQIAWKFMDKFDITDWNGNISIYNSFKDDLKKILKKYFNLDISRQIDPIKHLSTLSIMQMPNRIQQVALAILELGQGTIEKIANIAEIDINQTREGLLVLQKEGYAGVKMTDDGEVYFINKT